MALANYTDLKAALASWIVRSDLTSQIPDFIRLYESDANRRIRIRQNMTTTQLTLAQGASSVNLPSDFLEEIELDYDDTAETLTRAPFDEIDEEGIAENGLHFHLELTRSGRNIMRGPDGKLSTEARKLVGGLCEYADSLTAFGNTVSSAYLRLVPNQEAPTRVCWSDLNRTALIRVPLGWANVAGVAKAVNPRESEDLPDDRGGRQTVELRSPDGSAIVHLTLAGIVMAANWAFNGDLSLFKDYGPLELADKLYIKGNIFSDKELLKRLPVLPASCVESSRVLLQKRGLYERILLLHLAR